MLERLKALFGFGVQPDAPATAVEPEEPACPAPPPAVVEPVQVATPTQPPTADAPPPAGEPVLVHREVLNEELAVCGIEFFIRGDLQDKLNSQRNATRRFLDGMLLDHLMSLRQRPLRERSVWVQLSEASLMRLGTSRLPPQANVLLLANATEQAAGADTRETIATMQAAGHQVWLDDCPNTPWFASLADIAYGTTVRMALRLPIETVETLRRIHETYRHLHLGAWDVTSIEDYELARKLGCKRFSGSFVTRRQDWSGNELSPQMLGVASLINRIREESNFRAIAQVLKLDMAMSYRLLRYVNAAAQGLNQRISSIEQALVILGQDQLDRWLTLVLLSGGVMGDAALTEVALIRARFLERVGSQRLPPEQCERLFVLGLFSMLDVALRVPLATAIQPLHLPEVMNEALLHRQGPYGVYLSLADACERGISHEICKYALMLGLTTSKISVYQIEAINWVAEISAKPVDAVSI